MTDAPCCGKPEYWFDGPDDDGMYSAGCLNCGHWLAYDWKAWAVLKAIEEYESTHVAIKEKPQ